MIKTMMMTGDNAADTDDDHSGGGCSYGDKNQDVDDEATDDDDEDHNDNVDRAASLLLFQHLFSFRRPYRSPSSKWVGWSVTTPCVNLRKRHSRTQSAAGASLSPGHWVHRWRQRSITKLVVYHGRPAYTARVVKTSGAPTYVGD